MSMEEALYRAFSGGHDRERESFTEKLQELRERAGSRRAAAREAGVPESTWRRWEKGSKAKAEGAQKVEGAIRRERLAQNAPTDATFKIQTTDRQTGRNRSLDAARLKLAPGTMDRVREAYLRGDDKAAARELVNGVGDPWYRTYLSKDTEGGSGGSGGGGSARGSQDGVDDDEGAENDGIGPGDEAYDYDLGDLAYEGAAVGDADSDPAASVTGIG